MAFWGAIGAAVIGSTVSVYEGSASQTASKKAAAQSVDAQSQAVAQLQTAQTTASNQAQGALSDKRKAMMSSSDIYTSPLGLTGMATTAKKQLLGQ